MNDDNRIEKVLKVVALTAALTLLVFYLLMLANFVNISLKDANNYNKRIHFLEMKVDAVKNSKNEISSDPSIKRNLDNDKLFKTLLNDPAKWKEFMSTYDKTKCYVR